MANEPLRRAPLLLAALALACLPEIAAARDDLSAAFEQARSAADAARGAAAQAPQAPANADSDHQWLADIAGLAQAPDGMTTSAEVLAAPGSAEPGCGKLNAGLRAMVFRHFANVQAMENAQGVRLDGAVAERWAHVLAMILKESSGDSTDVTDMHGREAGTFKPMTSLARWRALFDHGGLSYDKQTNYGLAQLSYDRLSTPLTLPETDALDFLAADKKIDLDTAHAARRVLWVYQDFAQGRVAAADARITEADRGKPQFQERARRGLKNALWH